MTWSMYWGQVHGMISLFSDLRRVLNWSPSYTLSRGTIERANLQRLFHAHLPSSPLVVCLGFTILVHIVVADGNCL